MAFLARAFTLLLFVSLVAGCARTRVIEKRVEVPVEVMTPVPVLPDTSFVAEFGSIMRQAIDHNQQDCLDGLSADASDSEILKCASVELQYHRLLWRTLIRFFLQLEEQ